MRTKIVKNIAMKLLEMYPDLFSTDFEKNKRLVEELTDIKFKHLKNRVAGYVTRLVKINMRSLESEEEEIESPESESTTD
ncbi:MAG: 30S ribosomal protein S17e [Nitrososphaerota archaeon]|nr:30S ribosomal protein S17e [Nitrososphaerota archaeon]